MKRYHERTPKKVKALAANESFTKTKNLIA